MGKPSVSFCWACSRKLYGNHHEEILVDEHMRILHKQCAKYIKEGREDLIRVKEPSHE